MSIELEELEAQLASRGWTLFASDPVGLLRAERLGSVKHEQAAITPDALLDAVETAEARLEENRRRLDAASVRVQVGVASTESMRPLRAK